MLHKDVNERMMRLKVILNPKSKNGDKRHLQTTIKDKFGHSLIGIDQTAYPGHGTYLAQRATKEKVDTVVAVGGDGTVNEVLNGIVGTEVALGVIPTGTANDFACLYHIPSDVARACDVIREQCLVRADVICVNERYYVTAGGMGFPCEVVSLANRIKLSSLAGKLFSQFLGSKIYLFAALFSLAKKIEKGHFFDVRWDSGSLSVDSLALMVDNQPFLGRNFLMSPEAVNNDGLLDVCLIENSKSRVQILSILMKVLTGSHVNSASVRQWRTPELTIQTERMLPFLGDGELFGQGVEFRIKIVPKCLKAIVPKAYLRNQNPSERILS
jgi:diacylglycerol kinase (ATP)